MHHDSMIESNMQVGGLNQVAESRRRLPARSQVKLGSRLAVEPSTFCRGDLGDFPSQRTKSLGCLESQLPVRGLKMFDALTFLAWLPAERISNLVDLRRSRRISMNQSSEAMPQRGGAGLANWHPCLMLPHAASTTPLDSLGLLRTR